MKETLYAFLDHPGPIPFAHRGGALEAPENTWASFAYARDLGYRYMETDVHATRDGVVVVMHDPDLSRTSGSSALVRDMDWNDLSAVRLRSGEAIPRLDELLGAWPEVRWNIDAKHGSVVGPLIETIHRCDAIDRVCVSSFSDRRVGRLKRALGPRACAVLGRVRTARLRMVSVAPERGTSPWSKNLAHFAGFAAAQVPISLGRVPIVDHRFVETAHAAGLQVHVWTVDDEAAMVRLLDLGVDGIMTDRPSALKEVLVRRGQWY
jgi:glycerophosphoryl diester phosphodiesterase